jgi:hypothetical protein
MTINVATLASPALADVILLLGCALHASRPRRPDEGPAPPHHDKPFRPKTNHRRPRP